MPEPGPLMGMWGANLLEALPGLSYVWVAVEALRGREGGRDV